MPTQDDQPTPSGPDGGTAYPLEGQCTEVVRNLYLFIDNELDESNLALIQGHLEACSPCLEAFEFEADFKSAVAAAVAQDCPAEVRQRVLAQLRVVLPSED